jgi:hypothetical protein
MSVAKLLRSYSLTEVNEKTGLTRQEWRTNEGIRAGMCGFVTRRNLGLSFGKYTTLFQTEEYAIKACAVENLDTYHKNRNIYIP